MEAPAQLKYSEEHIWVRLEGKQAVIGMTDFAQEELGDIVFVELPPQGEALKKGEPFGSVESIKSVTELYAPVSGRVTRTNPGLKDMPGKLNLEPYGEWLAVIEITDPSELDALWDADRYAAAFGDAEEQPEE
ncbi:glycine cleavage system H protein [Paenibacillus sp. J31TS4]|uniref:glycine cleavage system protein GcvH n=1 Tax=Paenibacillus sp. J31TS4 TaxID=2807195 RepID=UPI001B0CBB4F|nr:glycine cleavage system protein GcvH [Paenibacillus sp. J31TS4]GIP38876.1 glycine cleavage system H protein [Paenibacillus sp. J31TS4]